MKDQTQLGGCLSITMKNLQVAYGNTMALSAQHLKVQGRIIAIIGHNGSGKSTMLKSLLGLLMPRSGSIESCWISEKGEAEKLIPERHMAFSPENGAVFEDLPVESYIRLWCRIKRNDANHYRRDGAKFIEELRIKPLFSKLGRELSKGQRRRVQACVGFLCDPKLFLFDEPFDGLDIFQSAELSNIMLEASNRMAIIVSSHRMEVVERIADVVVVLRDGKPYTAGTVDQVCSLLCGGSILISRFHSNTLPIERVFMMLKEQFYSCLINRIGHQLVITGNDVSLPAVASFFSDKQICDLKLEAIQPSLVDAMRYHLDKMQ